MNKRGSHLTAQEKREVVALSAFGIILAVGPLFVGIVLTVQFIVGGFGFFLLGLAVAYGGAIEEERSKNDGTHR